MGEKLIASNRKARAKAFILETMEAGIQLKGSEVKSLRQGGANLSDSFARVENDEVYLYNCHISPYSHKGYEEIAPLRVRKLLLHKRQIEKLKDQTMQKGFTIIPLSLYFKNGLAKVEIGICKGKKLFDKRETIKKREQDIAMRRAVRSKNR